MPDVTYGFNGNPDSIVTGSAFYTIPSGNYAYVSAVNAVAAFEVDGEEILPPSSTGYTHTVTGASATIFTNGLASHSVRVSVASTGATGSVVLHDGTTGVFLIDNSNPKPVEVSVPPSWSIRHSDSGAGRTTHVTLATNPVSIEFWAPEGTTIEGGEYIVQLF